MTRVELGIIKPCMLHRRPHCLFRSREIDVKWALFLIRKRIHGFHTVDIFAEQYFSSPMFLAVISSLKFITSTE